MDVLDGYNPMHTLCLLQSPFELLGPGALRKKKESAQVPRH